jgi:hypothetical protein
VLQPDGQLFIYTRTPQQNARTIWGRYFPGFTEHEQRLHSQAAIRDAVRRTDGLTMVTTQTFQHPRTSTAERLGAQARGRHYSTFSFYTPQELRAAIATFLARLPGPEVSWVDEHLLVIAGGSRHNQAEPDRPASLTNQAIKDQALQISAGHAGQAPQRRPGSRSQITPIGAPPASQPEKSPAAPNGGSSACSDVAVLTRGHRACPGGVALSRAGREIRQAGPRREIRSHQHGSSPHRGARSTRCVFIVSRRTGRSGRLRPGGIRRRVLVPRGCLGRPARPCRTRRHYAGLRGARGRVMAWPAAGYGAAAAGGLGGGEDEQA